MPARGRDAALFGMGRCGNRKTRATNIGGARSTAASTGADRGQSALINPSAQGVSPRSPPCGPDASGGNSCGNSGICSQQGAAASRGGFGRKGRKIECTFRPFLPYPSAQTTELQVDAKHSQDLAKLISVSQRLLITYELPGAAALPASAGVPHYCPSAAEGDAARVGTDLLDIKIWRAPPDRNELVRSQAHPSTSQSRDQSLIASSAPSK
jgi:hypothetical protein